MKRSKWVLVFLMSSFGFIAYFTLDTANNDDAKNRMALSLSMLKKRPLLAPLLNPKPFPQIANKNAGTPSNFETLSIKNQLAQLSDLHTRAGNHNLDLDAFTEEWAQSLSLVELKQLGKTANDTQLDWDSRYLAVYMLGMSEHSASEEILHSVLLASPNVLRALQNEKTADLHLITLTLDALARRGSERSLALLTVIQTSALNPNLRYNAELSKAAILKNDPALLKRQHDQALKTILGRNRLPSQTSRFQQSFSNIRDHADVADLGPSLRAHFESELGIDFSTFQSKRDADEFSSDSRRVLNALAFIKYVTFSRLNTGIVNENYYNFLKARISKIARASGQDEPETLARAWSNNTNTEHKWNRNRMEIYDTGIRQSLFGLSSTLLHEARHIQGFGHIDCTRDARKKACDSSYAARGSQAVELEYAARVALLSTNTSQFIKTLARLSAVGEAISEFNTPALIPEAALLIRTADAFYVATRKSLERLPSQPKRDAHYVTSYNGLLEGNPSANAVLVDPQTNIEFNITDAAFFNGFGAHSTWLRLDLEHILPSKFFDQVIVSDDLSHRGDTARSACNTQGLCSLHVVSPSDRFHSMARVNTGNMPLSHIRISVDERLSDLTRFVAELSIKDQPALYFKISNLFSKDSAPIKVEQVNEPAPSGADSWAFIGETKLRLLNTSGHLKIESSGSTQNKVLSEEILKQLVPIQGKILGVHEYTHWPIAHAVE